MVLLRFVLVTLALLVTACCTSPPPMSKSAQAAKADPKVPIQWAPNLCADATLMPDVAQMTPTVMIILGAAPNNGGRQMESLAAGMGKTQMCCATWIALQLLNKMVESGNADPEKVASATARGQAYILLRCSGPLEEGPLTQKSPARPVSLY